jgi:hypothetical protein
MYANGKMRPVETITGIGRGWIKDNGGGSKFNFDIRTFVDITMYPQYNNKNKTKNKGPILSPLYKGPILSPLYIKFVVQTANPLYK